VVLGEDGAVKDTLSAKNILIASGSEVTPLPGVAVDEKKDRIVHRRARACRGAQAPRCGRRGDHRTQLGSVWRRLGSEVTVVEFLDRITPGVDDEITKQLQRSLTKQGLKFKLSSKVTKAETTDLRVNLGPWSPPKAAAAETLQADIVLVAIGRRPLVEGLGPTRVGVKLTAHAASPSTLTCRLRCPGSTHRRRDRRADAGPQGERGRASPASRPSQARRVTSTGTSCPPSIYTQPEVAWVGQDRGQLKAAGVATRSASILSRRSAQPGQRGDGGFVKVLADKATARFWACTSSAAEAGTQDRRSGLAMEFSASAEDIAASASPSTVNEATEGSGAGCLGQADPSLGPGRAQALDGAAIVPAWSCRGRRPAAYPAGLDLLS